ncbi:HNH endonuclease family protein [Gloeocapsa sp. PCC 73106]|uniref:HNH endonuclease family protein n=1 Tax=Gloeocapsa sp. PCC 73106 TaxID=102232 RepID=UPI0002AC8FE6|nr:DUF1524 domain-containing protein [Gloeocapsa sp. PCC 73106]ELR98412.1 Protein of unknown function (DUF1524) [Gloeocapsa sp. PCC 73106]
MTCNREYESQIQQAFEDLNTLKVDVAYPFLLEVYRDYSQGLLNCSEFLQIIRLIESYVLRRAICGIPTNAQNKTFATLSREINKKNYLTSVQSALVNKSSYQRFPRDDEFLRELLVKDIYSFRNCYYLLQKLENSDRTKELVKAKEYTIKHIIPQNPQLSPVWMTELGPLAEEIRNKYLHTLGNLTLTGYNSEYSDRSFAEKRDLKNGFANSPLNLNRGLAKCQVWNESAIKKRAEELGAIAVKVWSYPLEPR